MADNDDDDDKKKPTANNIPANIGRMFGLSPLNPVTPLQLKKNGKIITPDIEQTDYEYGRSNIRDLIEKGNTLLAEFSQIAGQAQEPRHYEVLTNLFTSLLEANQKLLDLKKAELDIKEKELKIAGGGGPENVTNNLIIGSTDDMLTMLDTRRKNKQDKNSGNDNKPQD